MMWNTGVGVHPWMWLVMGGLTVAFWAAVVLAVRSALGDRGPRDVRRGGHRAATAGTASQARPRGVTGPLDVLQGRLVRGEIDVDEYARTRRVLVESDPALDPDRTTGTPP